MFTNRDREYLVRHINRIESMLFALLRTVSTEGENAMAKIDDLATAVQQQTTVIEGATTLIDGLVEQLAAAGADPAKLDALKAAIEANTDRLAAAVARHTPADDEVHAAQM